MVALSPSVVSRTRPPSRSQAFSVPPHSHPLPQHLSPSIPSSLCLSVPQSLSPSVLQSHAIPQPCSPSALTPSVLQSSLLHLHHPTPSLVLHSPTFPSPSLTLPSHASSALGGPLSIYIPKASAIGRLGPPILVCGIVPSAAAAVGCGRRAGSPPWCVLPGRGQAHPTPPMLSNSGSLKRVLWFSGPIDQWHC